MKNKIDYTLYLVTDRSFMSSATIEESVKQSILGGCTVIQLREKNISSREFYEIAKRVKKITSDFGVPLIINDRVDIAVAVDADGVHIGQDDLPIEVVRDIIGNKKIIGVSASNFQEAIFAANSGADYLGVGAMYETGTKIDVNITTMDELHRIREAVKIPIVVIGGINKKTIPNFRDTGIDGIAVVSAIVVHNDVTAAAKEIKNLFVSECMN